MYLLSRQQQEEEDSWITQSQQSNQVQQFQQLRQENRLREDLLQPNETFDNELKKAQMQQTVQEYERSAANPKALSYGIIWQIVYGIAPFKLMTLRILIFIWMLESPDELTEYLNYINDDYISFLGEHDFTDIHMPVLNKRGASSS